MAVRALRRSDLPQVVDLYLKTFRAGRSLDPRPYLEHFEEVYFENPWVDEGQPSFVGDDGDGRIWGFFGGIPRPMRAGCRALRTVVAGKLMVRSDAAGAFGSIQLTKALIQRDYDVVITDTATVDSRRVWERCGGVVAPLYSLWWVRPFRPLSLGVDRMMRNRRAIWRPLAAGLCRVVDGVAQSAGLLPMPNVHRDCRAAAARVEELVACISSCEDYSVTPEYRTESLEWLLDVAGRRIDKGKLKRRIVRNGGGKCLGCYVYYSRPQGTSEVLLIAATPGSFDFVFACLLEEASRERAVALWGRMDPRYMQNLSANRCLFVNRMWVLVHTRDDDLLRSFDRGEVLFTGVDGEQWLGGDY